MLRVITFNVLAPELASAKAFPNSTKEQLDPQNRLTLLKGMLELWIGGASYDGRVVRNRWEDMKPIICLQELTLEWVGELSLWLMKRNYNLFATNYGNVHCGYMGVGIAVPRSIELLKVQYGLPADWFHEDSTPGGCDVPEEVWNMARSKYNRYVALKLKDNINVPYWIVTYHMPCCWRSPELMMALSSILRSCIDGLTAQEPVILVGDFNFTPYSPPYMRLLYGATEDITSGSCNAQVPPNSTTAAAISTLPFISAGEVSYSCRSGSPPPFEAQLDYILYRGEGWKSAELEPVYTIEGSIPNNFHPSDHLPLVARIHRNNFPCLRTPSLKVSRPLNNPQHQGDARGVEAHLQSERACSTRSLPSLEGSI